MKTVKKKFELEHNSTEIELNNCMFGGSTKRYIYTFSSSELLPNIETMECFVEVEEPETLKEFLEENNIPKKELVQWLNKNYK